MVMAQSLFIALKQQNPDCLIDVLAPSWTFDLLDRMPEVHSALPMPPLKRGQLGLSKRIDQGRDLRSGRYDQAILLPNSWKSALTPYFANIPLRTGYLGECRWGLLNDIRYLDKFLLTQTVQRFVALSTPGQARQAPVCPEPKLRANRENQLQALNKFSLNESSKLLALCPGAEYGEAKRWPSAHFADVARIKLSEGWQVWLFGSKKDSDVAGEINRLNQNACVDLTGKTSIKDAVDLLSLATAVISNDSGLMHVAAALQKNLIAIYGSSDPNFTPPLSAKAKILSLQLDCSPCFKRTCPLGHTHCLVELTPLLVINALDAMLAE